jgi:NADPH-dependent 2,4-dienoyl-CoA reductase/sulfur reductase-like enzyme
LPKWDVERKGDRVVVSGKTVADPLAPTYPAPTGAMPKSVVVIGAGAAGSAAAEMLRRCGFGGSITMVDADADAPYDRPNLSKDYLAGNAPEEWIPLRPAGFHEQHGISLLLGRVDAIDPAAKSINVNGHGSIPYDALVIATGAEPIVLPIPGADLPHVHRLRSLADCRRIIAGIEGKGHAVIIGGSFIGLEVAAALRARKLEVRVVAPETVPLERIVGTELGTYVRDLHQEHGVEFFLGHKPASIETNRVILDDGTELRADIVVMGVGVRPRLDLATAAGLRVDKGVVVNEYLETSVQGIYAAGDIARYPDRRFGAPVRVEHWVVAQRMGQTAARNILGARERFDDVPFFWSAHYDVSINYVGHAEQVDRVIVDGSAKDHDVAVRLEQPAGQIKALATIYRDGLSLETEREMEQAGR